MTLLKFELRKLLLNKKSLIILSILLVCYSLLGVGMSIFSFGSVENYNTYSSLANAAAGPYNEEQAQISEAIYNTPLDPYGDSRSIQHMAEEDPELRFHVDYYAYSQRVDEYWNGPETQDFDNIKGVYPMQDRIATLEAEGLTDSYEYQKLSSQLETELTAGEPEFHNVALWDSLISTWGGTMIAILLFFPMSFLIAPVYTKEKTTGMDNIILSSKHGQGQIVLAKIAAVAVTCAVTAMTFFGGTFAGIFIPFGTLAGIGLPLKTLGTFANTQLAISIGGFAALAIVWVIFVAVAYGIIVTLISSKMKNQAGVFGIGILILIANLLFQSMGTSITALIEPIINFGFLNTVNVTTVFGGATTLNMFGMVVSYPIMALIVLLALGILAFIGVRISQKYRTVA